MLPSWIDKIRIQGCESVALVLSRDTLASVKVADCHGRRSIKESHQAGFSRRMFAKEHHSDDIAVMSTAITEVTADLNVRGLPLYVALPDLMIKASVYELDEMPKARRERDDFIMWRLAKEHGQGEDEVECRVDYLGAVDNRQLVYAQIADKYWLGVVRAALSACSLMPWTINSYSYYRHNYMANNGSTDSTLLLAIDDGNWSLTGWDKHQRVRISTTRLICDDIDEQTLASIAREAVRAARVFGTKQGEEGAVKLYVHADHHHVDYMRTAMEGPLSCGVAPVETPDDHRLMNDDLRLQSLGYMSAIS